MGPSVALYALMLGIRTTVSYTLSETILTAQKYHNALEIMNGKNRDPTSLGGRNS